MPFDKKTGGSKNMAMLAHVTGHDGRWKAADVELEQDPNRPYAYLSGFVNYDFQIYEISNTATPEEALHLVASRIPSCTAASARWTASTSR